MRAGHVHHDRQPETDPAAAVLVAGGVEPGEGAQRLLEPVGRDAGAVILDPDAQRALGQRHGDLGLRAVAQRVADQVLKRAPHALDPQHHLRIALSRDEPHLPARAAHVLDHLRGKFHHGDRHRLALLRVAREIEEPVEQPLHVLDIVQERRRLVLVDHREPQPQPRQRRAHVVAHPRQHQRALLDLPLDPGAHVEKGAARRLDLDRAGGPVGHRPPPAERLGRLREPRDRPELVAQVEIRDHRHQRRGPEEVDEQQIRPAGRDMAAIEGHLQRPLRVAEDEADMVVVGQQDTVEVGKRRAQLADHDDTRKIVPAPPVLRRHGVLGDAAQRDLQRVGHRRVGGLPHQLDLADHRLGHLLGDALEMPLDKDDRDHDEQRHHRQQQGQRRTGEEAARQIGFEPGQSHG